MPTSSYPEGGNNVVSGNRYPDHVHQETLRIDVTATALYFCPSFSLFFSPVLACKHRHHPAEETGAYDLTQIKDSGELVVLTLYSSTTYFIYRGTGNGIPI